MTKKQPIIDELHSVREALLSESGGTLAGLVARLRAEQAASGRIILPARRAELAETAQSNVGTDGKGRKD